MSNIPHIGYILVFCYNHLMNINRISSGGMDNVQRRPPTTQEPGTAEPITPPTAEPKRLSTLSPVDISDIDPETARSAREAGEFGKRLREKSVEEAVAALIVQYRMDTDGLLMAMAFAAGLDTEREAAIRAQVEANREIAEALERKRGSKKK